jgi:hypothetical protein
MSPGRPNGHSAHSARSARAGSRVPRPPGARPGEDWMAGRHRSTIRCLATCFALDGARQPLPGRHAAASERVARAGRTRATR